MKEIDNYAEETLGIPHKELMKKAGDSIADIIAKDREPLTQKGEYSAIILAGTGNNGGDGYVIAADLAALGWRVAVFELMPEFERKGPAAYYRKEAKKILKRIYSISDRKLLSELLPDADVAVDAVFGYGGRAELSEDVSYAFDLVNRAYCKRYAVDCPSGIDPEFGGAAPSAFMADVTAALSYPMRGLYLFPARGYAGEVKVCDIGLDYGAIERTFEFSDYVSDGELVSAVLPKREADTHKGMYGKLFMLCGSDNMIGAARLAVTGALRTGVGLVSLAATEKAVASIASNLCEPIYYPIKPHAQWTQADIDAIVGEAEKADAILIGPGCGVGVNLRTLIVSLLGTEGCPIILDADALNSLEGHPQVLASAVRETVITPHPKEFCRLFDVDKEELKARRYETVTKTANTYGITVLLKGADTVVAAPGSLTYLNPTGNAGLAKGGSGDVLAGMIASFSAQGIVPTDAAAVAALLHGAAGDKLAEEISESGFLPSELPLAVAKLLGEFGR